MSAPITVIGCFYSKSTVEPLNNSYEKLPKIGAKTQCFFHADTQKNKNSTKSKYLTNVFVFSVCRNAFDRVKQIIFTGTDKTNLAATYDCSRYSHFAASRCEGVIFAVLARILTVFKYSFMNVLDTK